MKRKTLVAGTATLLLVAATVPSFADRNPNDLLGDPASPAAAEHTIVLFPQTTYVNVTGGDIVKFVVDGKAFAWHFDGAETVSAFDLRKVAPPGMLKHEVKAYIAPDPTYLGG